MSLGAALAEMLCETRDAGAAVRGNSEVMMINAEIVANATVRPAMESYPLRVDISRPHVTASAKLTRDGQLDLIEVNDGARVRRSTLEDHWLRIVCWMKEPRPERTFGRL